MRIAILESKEFDYVCENPKCPKLQKHRKENRYNKKILRITTYMTNYLHICFDCLKKGITLNLEVAYKQ